MSFHSWLQNLRFALASGRGQHFRRRCGVPRATRHRPSLEGLEDRCLPAFLAPVGYGADGNAHAVVTGDFNRDGRLDLATANQSPSNNVSIYLGNGDGSFQDARNYATDLGPTALAAGDFNGDGKLDLVTGHWDEEINLLLGNGDGSFQWTGTWWWADAADPPSDMAVGDFDADGNLDLALSSPRVIAVLLGDGQAGFEFGSHLFVSNPDGAAIVAADFNHDGKADLAWGASVVDVRLSNGDGTFRPAQSYATDYLPSVSVADLNGDGNIDLVTSNVSWSGGTSNESASVLLGNGDGTFQAAQNHAGRGLVGDFNGDGSLDLLARTSLLPGNGNDAGTFSPDAGPQPRDRYSGWITVGDFNGDGRWDLADAFSVQLNDGNWLATKTWVGPTGGNWSASGNWSPAGVPAAGDQVLIGGGRSVSLSSGATVAGITLTGGAQLVVGASGSRVLRASKISIDAISSLDLNDNDLILDYKGSSPLNDILSLLARGRGPSPTGILSSTANASAGSLVLGVAEASKVFGISEGQNATFFGQTVDATTVLIKHTVKGDLDLDGGVSIADFINLSSNFGKTSATYSDGDLNYDGVVTISDFIELASNFNNSLPPPPPARPQPAAALSSSSLATEIPDNLFSQTRHSNQPVRLRRHHLRRHRSAVAHASTDRSRSHLLPPRAGFLVSKMNCSSDGYS
jgi:hypothetical protein